MAQLTNDEIKKRARMGNLFYLSWKIFGPGLLIKAKFTGDFVSHPASKTKGFADEKNFGVFTDLYFEGVGGYKGHDQADHFQAAITEDRIAISLPQHVREELEKGIHYGILFDGSSISKKGNRFNKIFLTRLEEGEDSGTQAPDHVAVESEKKEFTKDDIPF